MPGQTMRRSRGMYFPPWLPPVIIIFIVFGILAVLFIRPWGAAGRPLIGQDYWIASYEVVVCSERQPNFPAWEGGVNTYGDGVIHIRPRIPTEEGAGARLGKWFEYGGGKLTQSEMRMPGKRETFKNGDTCEDGSEGVLQVFVNDEKLDDWSRYIPQDGDHVQIEFGPEGPTSADQGDRIVIDESEATRTVGVEITEISGDRSTAAFEPNSVELRPGETVKLAVKNLGEMTHFIRVAGVDGEYDTGDDFVSEPEAIVAGKEGVLVVRFDEEGEFEFQDPTAPNASGTLVVAGEPVEDTDEPAPDDGASEPVDVTLDVTMGDNFFEPNELEVEAGQRFRINLANEGNFVHNLRIAGPDDTFDTGDDLESTPDSPKAGEAGELVGQIDEPGVYRFRSDFQAGEMVGTITVK